MRRSYGRQDLVSLKRDDQVTVTWLLSAAARSVRKPRLRPRHETSHCRLLAALILGGSLTITGIAFASKQVVSRQVTSESVSTHQTNQETSTLERLALALSAGNDAMRPLRGSQTEYREKDRLDPPIPDMECDVDRIVSYVSCYSFAMGTREEAGNLFTRFVDDLQSTLPSDRWRKVEEEPRINSTRSCTYADQESDAHIDIDLIALSDSYIVAIFGWPAIYP